MKFENIQKDNGGVIVLHNDEQSEVGRLTYTLTEDRLIISYVMVHSQFEGRGMGKYLVEEAIKFGENKGLKIYPHCSYARSVMNKMPQNDHFIL